MSRGPFVTDIESAIFSFALLFRFGLFFPFLHYCSVSVLFRFLYHCSVIHKEQRKKNGTVYYCTTVPCITLLFRFLYHCSVFHKEQRNSLFLYHCSVFLHYCSVFCTTVPLFIRNNERKMEQCIFVPLFHVLHYFSVFCTTVLLFIRNNGTVCFCTTVPCFCTTVPFFVPLFRYS